MAKMPNRYADRPYEVGKGKPPVHTRFGNGQPTNRGGRTKASKNADTILREALEDRIEAVENGKTRRITKYEAGVLQVVNKAAQGDLPSFRMVLDLKRELDARGDTLAGQPLSDDDRQLLQELAANLTRASQDG